MAVLRKAFVLALLIMFVMSIVPLVAAERGDEKFARKEVRSTERVRTANSEETSDNSPEKTANRVKIREHVEKTREDLEEVKVKYREAKEKYTQAKERYNTEKEKFKEVKERAKKCASDTEECQLKKTELKKGVLQHLLKTDELITRSLEKLTDRVQNSNTLTEEQKAEALASIQELETTLTVEKEQVTALAENATNAELREAIQNLKHTWQDVRKEQRKIVSMLISAKLENLSERLTQFGASMQQSIDQLKAAGKDTTELEALYADFSGKVEALKTAPATEAAALLQEAKELLRQFKAAEEKLKESAAENETEEETPENETSEENGAETETNTTTTNNSVGEEVSEGSTTTEEPATEEATTEEAEVVTAPENTTGATA